MSKTLSIIPTLLIVLFSGCQNDESENGEFEIPQNLAEVRKPFYNALINGNIDSVKLLSTEDGFQLLMSETDSLNKINYWMKYYGSMLIDNCTKTEYFQRDGDSLFFYRFRKTAVRYKIVNGQFYFDHLMLEK